MLSSINSYFNFFRYDYMISVLIALVSLHFVYGTFKFISFVPKFEISEFAILVLSFDFRYQVFAFL
jgi:hypothetical protein